MRLRTFVLALALGGPGCHHDPQPMHPKPGELPPLPPASGTPVGYLIDNSTELKLRDDQLKQLKDIDSSLAARDADLDTQLRQLERPEEEEQLSPQQQKAGMKRKRHNHAPGASTVTNADASKLHDLRNANDRESLKQAWVLLDAAQQASARRLLEDRGVEVPGQGKKSDQASPDDGKPVPGLEP